MAVVHTACHLDIQWVVGRVALAVDNQDNVHVVGNFHEMLEDQTVAVVAEAVHQADVVEELVVDYRVVVAVAVAHHDNQHLVVIVVLMLVSVVAVEHLQPVAHYLVVYYVAEVVENYCN